MLELLERAEQALLSDDLASARACYREVLALAPQHALAQRALRDVESALSTWYVRHAFVSLAVGLREVMSSSTDARETLLLSKLATVEVSVQEFVERSGMPPSDVHEIVFRASNAGLVRLR